MNKHFFVFIIIFMMLINTTPLYANMVWPSLYILHGMMTWRMIVIGLIIEFVFIKIFTKDSYLKSAIMDITINAFSALVGIIIIPLSGLFVELVLMPIDTIFSMGTFHIFHWINDFILAAFCNAIIESFVLKVIFKKLFNKIFLWVFCANIFSVIICSIILIESFIFPYVTFISMNVQQ